MTAFLRKRSAQQTNPLAKKFQTGKALFFVTGRSKSGTTWMGKLLGSHPELYCDTTENCAFHQDFSYMYFDTRTERMHPKTGLFFDTRTATLMKNGLLANLVFRCTKDTVKRYGDKTPRQSISKILEAFPETQIIIMLRDLRDVAVSLAFHRSRDIDTWQGIFTAAAKESLDSQFLRNYIESYTKHNDIQTYTHLAAERPRQVKIIRYEDLVNDTGETLRQTLSFLKVKTSDKVIEECVGANTFEKLSGGRKPGDNSAGSFFRKGIVGDWRNHFTDENVSLFKELAGEALIAAGYEDSDDWG